MTALYLDSSAFVKTVVEEAGAVALRRFLATNPAQHVSSSLLRAEAIRAVRHLGSGALTAAREGIQQIDLIAIDDRILDGAAVLDPGIIRTLDAIHLATALTIGDDLMAIVSYDTRMTEAAALLGLRTIAPS